MNIAIFLFDIMHSHINPFPSHNKGGYLLLDDKQNISKTRKAMNLKARKYGEFNSKKPRVHPAI